MYSLEQLRIFLSVYEAGSFSAAARKLGRAQSGVSQAIANLEIDIGHDLFDRSAHKPVLTEAGQALLPVVQAMVMQKNHLDQKIEALAREEETELTLVCDESLFDDALLQRISQISQRHPATNISVFAASTFEAEDMIAAGQAQLGVVYLGAEFKNEFEFFTLGDCRFVTVASPQHALAQVAGPIGGELLKLHRQLVHRDTQGRELWFSDRIAADYACANSHHTLLAMAQSGMGWTTLPEALAQAALECGDLVALDLDFEDGGMWVPIAAAVSRSHRKGPVLKETLQMLRQLFADGA